MIHSFMYTILHGFSYLNRWKIDYGSSMLHLEGELIGQTQFGYCNTSTTEEIPLNHPIDVHMAQSGLQVRQY